MIELGGIGRHGNHWLNDCYESESVKATYCCSYLIKVTIRDGLRCYLVL